MLQDRLIEETEDDVWDALIIACGGYKKVAGTLWPNLKPDTRYAKLKNCFRADKDERLTWEERKMVLRLGSEVGCHIGMHQLSSDLLYENPTPANRDRLKQEAKSQINIRIDELRDLIARAEKL